MKKSIILKSFLVILVSMMLVFTTSSVYAATDEGFNELLDPNGTENTNTGNTNTGNTNTRNTNTNTNRNSTNTNNTNRSNTNRNNTSNSLPNTGIQDSLPTVLLIAVFGISAVYAYKKIKDYRNID